MNSVALPAAEPGSNITVRASAGTGKTWLLITRLIRLLLAGAAPDSILAVTFTRKAAAEMQGRLRERLYGYLELDDALLDSELQQIGLTPDDGLRGDARQLFETLLRSERPVKVTTYHAFCQDVLRRFPFDAGVPPGFELVESEGLLAGEAWDALIAAASACPDGDTAAALQTLLDYHGNIDGPRDALLTFLAQRIDWWAYTQGEADPAAFAVDRLRQQLKIDAEGDPAADFFSAARLGLLKEFAGLLARHDTAGNRRHSELIHELLTSSGAAETRLARLRAVFFTDKGEPRKRKESAALARSLGEAGMARFLALHHELCEALETAQEQWRRRLTLAINEAWYRAGSTLLEHYRRLKEERRLLDFADLEWHTYLLLRHSDNALWVQYKLDRRIDHLLVDEFQDTNPTQWAMLLPLLEELAAGDPERQRSVFLVGDAKQSIYRFRRANPHLFATAGQWLETHLQARDCTLNKSRRSAPAIMAFVNRVFCDGPLGERLAPFPHHDTHLQTLWGRVELLPLTSGEAADAETETGDGGLRDPLTTPRTPAAEALHYLEGCAIAARIDGILSAGTLLEDTEAARPATYEDIMILVRSRTHIHHYERALREAGIPYLGGGKTTLLDCLEIQDLVALLETLIAPYNNLALAAVLRSPLFACSDAELMAIAEGGGGRKRHWFALLQDLAPQLPADSALGRAARLLARWRSQADQVPVHDLLDRIYCEGNVLARYQAGFPPHLQPRAQANLVRFIELALAVDSGRYPSLPHFLARIRSLQQHDQEALDEAPADQQGGVRIMTIHAAKGLEAPIVFLADAARAERRRRAFQLLLDWPAGAPRPRAFLLGGRNREADQESRRLAEAMEMEEQVEEANLLYVALTRARQWLMVSGCADRNGRPAGWYGAMAQQLGDAEDIAGEGWALESGTPPTAAPPAIAETPAAGTVDPRLARPLDAPPLRGEIAPSGTAGHDDAIGGASEGRQRGIVIHRLLERLSADPRPEPAVVLDAVTAEFHYSAADPKLKAWWQEAMDLLHNPTLATLFDPGRYRQAWNEIPLIYEGTQGMINGIVDRLVLAEDDILVVDYKTHGHARPENLAQLAAPYQEQLALYREGAQRLWPGYRVRALLLFTACGGIYEFEE
ncbi:MAG: UvrD-helicase domain-containing protein [Gammaproteobacteria bacterium]